MSSELSGQPPERPLGSGAGNAARTSSILSGDVLQAASAAAGTAAIVYVVGGMVMWLRFRKAGFPPDHAVALMERQQLLVIGLRLMVLPALVTGILAWIVVHRLRRRSTMSRGGVRGWVKAALLGLLIAFALLLPFSFASTTWVFAAVVVVGYLLYEPRPSPDAGDASSTPPGGSGQDDLGQPVDGSEPSAAAPASARRRADRRPALRARAGGLRTAARARIPVSRRGQRGPSPLVATMLVVAVAAAVSLGRQLDQPVQLLDATVTMQDAKDTVNGLYIGSDSDEIFIGVDHEIKAIQRSAAKAVTLGPPRDVAPSPSIASRVLGGNRFSITPFTWWCNGERYGWGDTGDLCRTQLQVLKPDDGKPAGADLAGDAVPIRLRCPPEAKRPCRGFLRLTSVDHYLFGPAGLPRAVVFGGRVRPHGRQDTEEAGIAPGRTDVMCVPVDPDQRGLLRTRPPVEDRTSLVRGRAKRRLPFDLTIAADEEGRNLLRSEPFVLSVTRPGQPIDYSGDCSTIRVRCRGRGGSTARANVRCTVTTGRRFTGEVTVSLQRGREQHALGAGEMDGRRLSVRVRAPGTLRPGRYQAFVRLDRGKEVLRHWTRPDEVAVSA